MADKSNPRTAVQMNFAVPLAIHQPLKIMAAQRNKRLTELVLEILAKAAGVPPQQKGGA